MSPKQCSLVLDVEENHDTTIALRVSRRNTHADSSSGSTASSDDVVEFGGTITVSF